MAFYRHLVYLFSYTLTHRKHTGNTYHALHPASTGNLLLSV